VVVGHLLDDVREPVDQGIGHGDQLVLVGVVAELFGVGNVPVQRMLAVHLFDQFVFGLAHRQSG
jgi:Na+-transporting NADH:ubiquinone oxidoreductase subunit NqrD